MLTYVKIDGKVYEKDLTVKERRKYTLATLEERQQFLEDRVERHKSYAKKHGLHHVRFNTSGYNQGTGYSAVAGGLHENGFKHGLFLDRIDCGQDVALSYCPPTAIKNLKKRHKYVVTYSMFESTEPPYWWKPQLKAADEVVVPTHWVRDIFRYRYGIDSTVIPHGINTNKFYYLPREEDGVCTFLHYDAFNWRKGWDLVFKAFRDEFSDDEPVSLIMKTTCSGVLPFDLYRTIEIVQENCTLPDLRALMARSDVFLFPSRGEGFGNTPLEAMATGMPAIAPNEHGISEYFDSRYMYGLNCENRQAIYGEEAYQRDMGDYRQAKINSVRQQLRRAFEDWKSGKFTSEYRREISDYARTWSNDWAAHEFSKLLAKYGD